MDVVFGVDWKQGCPARFFLTWGFRRYGMVWDLWALKVLKEDVMGRRAKSRMENARDFFLYHYNSP